MDVHKTTYLRSRLPNQQRLVHADELSALAGPGHYKQADKETIEAIQLQLQY